MNTTKAATIGSYVIATGAATLSYFHQQELYSANDLGAFSFVMPILVDLLALLAAAVRNTEDAPATLKKTATWTLVLAGLGSVGANVAVARNPVQVAVGVGTVVFYLLAENFVSALKTAAKAAKQAEEAASAVAMVAKTDAEAAIVAAVATAEAQLRATLAAETAALVAEVERITREAVAAELAAARAEAERLAATVAAPAPVATVANMATARVANGQAAERVVAILATGPDMATDEVAALAGASTRTVRRVRQQLATAAA